MAGPSPSAPTGLRIGHVHLRVSDLDRAVAFYRDVIGLEVQLRWGDTAAFLGADGYHHHVGLNTWSSRGAGPADPRRPGLFHTAFLYPTRAALARAVARVLACGVPLDGASDHGVSEAVYLSDPDGNGVELYRDRPEADWPRDTAGALTMVNEPLDVAALVAEASHLGSMNC